MTFTSSSNLLSKTMYSRPVLDFFSEPAHGESGYANKSTRVPMASALTFSFKSPCLSIIQHRLRKWGCGLESCNKDVPEMTSRPVTISPVPALKLRLVGGTGQHVTRVLTRPHGEPCGLGSGNQAPGCQATPTDPGTTTKPGVSWFWQL